MSYDPGVEFFGSSRPVPAAEACRSLGAALGVTEDEARHLLESGTAAAAIETRGPFLCNSCGGSLGWSSEICRCGRARRGDSKRDTPLPRPTLDGKEASTRLRRRYLDPSMLS